MKKVRALLVVLIFGNAQAEELFVLADECGYKGMEIFLSDPDSHPLNLRTPESIRAGHMIKFSSFSIEFVNDYLKRAGEVTQISCSEFKVDSLKLVLDVYAEYDDATYVSDGINLAIVDDSYIDDIGEISSVVKLGACYKVNSSFMTRLDISRN